MSRHSQYEKLTHVQLQQKVIHLESELSHYRTDREKKERKYHKWIMMLKQDNDRLKKELQEVLHHHETYNQERDELINDYNKLLMENASYQRKIDELEDGELAKLVEKLRKEIEIHKESIKRHLRERKISEATIEQMRKEISHFQEEYEEKNQLILKIRQLELALVSRKEKLEKERQDKIEVIKVNETIRNEFNQLQTVFTKSENNLKMYQEKEAILIRKIEKLNADLSAAHKKINQMKNEINTLNKELKNKDEVLSDVEKQNKIIGKDLQVLKEKQEQLQQKNVSYQQKIPQLEQEKNAALESVSHLQTELSNATSHIKELEELKTKLLKRLDNRVKEVRKLQKEKNNFVEEKVALLNKLGKLEEENASFHESVLNLSAQRKSDENRLDKITTNLNEVFTEIKQLVRMTSSLKHQLEAKTIELNQMKKEKEMLMQEVVQLKEDYEKSEARKNELEKQIEMMRTELMKAQNSLSRLEQFESEKLKLKEDLESKIEAFNMLTEHYQREKESYLNVLEHVQDQVNVYKEKSEYFDTEKGSWSKQIDELKAELSQTKATLVKMEELEQENKKLTSELQVKEIEIYKTKKESDRALQQQMEQFKAELKLYQEKIAQYEKDREIWEKQMKQMKAQFAGLESSLEEKENFIKQYIKQPLSSLSPGLQNTNLPAQQISAPYEQTASKPAPQQNRQPADWFQRMVSQQQVSYQPVQKSQPSHSTTMDFFTLRSKTTQPTVPTSYGSQWNQESP